MVNLKLLIIGIVGVFLLYSIITKIMTFLGVSPTVYVGYMYWFMALILFFIILPKKSGTLFE